jgi:predicted CDP-diglyceride synthetase/phosphatidate cytidylyltransferase
LWGFSPLENIVAFTVAAAAILMGVSLFVNKPDASKDVLPFVIGLIGFMGGLVTSMFRQNLGIRATSIPENGSQEPQERKIEAQGASVPSSW